MDYAEYIEKVLPKNLRSKTDIYKRRNDMKKNKLARGLIKFTIWMIIFVVAGWASIRFGRNIVHNQNAQREAGEAVPEEIEVVEGNTPDVIYTNYEY